MSIDSELNIKIILTIILIESMVIVARNFLLFYLIFHPPIVFILDVVLVHCVLDSFLFIYCVTFIVNKLFKNANTSFQLRPYNKRNSEKLYNFDFFTLCIKGEYTVNDYRVYNTK